METYWFYSGSKEISLHAPVTIKKHTVHFTIYFLDENESQIYFALYTMIQ
jgi:hypothetical protein